MYFGDKITKESSNTKTNNSSVQLQIFRNGTRKLEMTILG